MDMESASKTGTYDMPLRQMLTYRVTRVHALMSAQAQRILKENGDLSLSQWRVLVLIDYLGPTNPAHIAREILMDKGQLSRVLKIMSEKGVIRVDASESDHRAHLVSLTHEGRALFERARPAMRQRQAAFTKSLTEQEHDVFLRALEKLEKAAGL